MKIARLVAGSALLLAAAASSAKAQMVAFTTTGLFNGPTCVNATSCTVGGMTLGFNGANTLVTSPSGVTFGDFITTGATATPQSFNGVSFTLTVTQTSPVAGSNSVLGQLTGSISATQSNPQLVFTPSSSTFNIDGAFYTINPANINPPSSRGGVTTIEGSVSTVPEPSTYALMAAGLAGLGVVARRRRQTQA